MAMQRKNFLATGNDGLPVVSPTVTVFESGTLDLADLFSDDLGSPTPLSNPFTGAANGRFGFYAPDGLVDIVVSGTGIASPYSLPAEQFDYTLSLTALGSFVESINGDTTATQTIVAADSGVDLAIATVAGETTISIPNASGANRGLLHPSDFTDFANRLKSLNGLTEAIQTFVTGSGGNDVNISGDGISVHIFNFPSASASKRGLLTAADFSTFLAKQNALSLGTSLQYVRGDLTNQTLNTTIVPEGSNLYFTTARTRTALAAPTAPLAYNSSTGVFSIPAASGSVDGYLSAANFTVFNGKLEVLNGLTNATQTFAVGTSGTDFAVVSSGSAHTFNLPSASAANRGVVTTGTQTLAGDKTLSGRLTTGSGRNIKTRVVIAAGAVTVATIDEVVIVNKTVGAATVVNLPATPTTGDVYCVKDGKGDANSNNITITPAAGTIDGAATLVMNVAYQAVWLIYNGSEWNVI